LKRSEAIVVHVAAGMAGATGVVYGWMRYALESDDPYALANHPWQPFVQHAHIVASPLLVFACGLIWRDHVWLGVRSAFRPRRKTGLQLAASLFPMIVSGPMIQVSISEGARTFWVVVHVVSSSLWLLAYLVHQLSSRSRSTEEHSADVR
jgi:hypothetical protein